MSGSLVRLALLVILAIPAQAGYDQYFTWHSRPSPQALHEAIAEMRLVIEASRSKLAGPDGDGQPEIGSDSVVFNGIGDDSHEPFFFPGIIEDPSPGLEPGFNAIKTAGKPYDAVVTACLLVARDHFPANVLAIGSDGEWPEDWLAGAQLYRSVLHRPAQDPIDGEVVTGHPAKHPQSSLPAAGSTKVMLAVLGAAALLFLMKQAMG